MEWVDRVGEDIAAAFREARAGPDGAVGRGPQWHTIEGLVTGAE
ncbi:hypothetical protein [Micromonospora citrea]|nr:hypothetical protein [Micromonospora citrea]